ncbi:MAG: peptidoglycan DD-metalloendopeptidase family protein [Terricaulis sp.]
MAQGAKRARALVALAAGALATFASVPADAQNRSLAQVERDRRAESARAERLRTEAIAARREVSALDAQLHAAERRRAEADTAATASEQRLALLSQQIESGAASQRRSREAFENALIVAALNSRRAELGAVRQTIFARAAAPALAQEERRSGRALAEARTLSDETAQERSILAEAQASIEVERRELATLLARRRTTQTALANDAAAAERRSRQLASQAQSLRQLAARVQPAAVRRGSAGPNVIPAGWLAPTSGQIVRGFGVRSAGGPASQGVALRTAANAAVRAPAAGRVAYAGPFRSYGHVLILNLDGGYALVLTGLGTISAQVGEPVHAGQPIGEMPGTDTPAPELYVEVRRNGQPVDPGRWLTAQGLAAQRNLRAG